MQPKRFPSRHSIVRWCLVPLLILTACTSDGTSTPQGAPTATASPRPVVQSASATAAPTAVPTQSTESAELPEPSPTQQPTALPTIPYRPCDPATDTIDAAYVYDVNLVDGARLAPSTRFMKIWLVRNTGTCSWPTGTELTRIAGDALSGPASIPISSIGPAREVQISIMLETPGKPGQYESFWRLRTPEGRLFGAVLFISISVEEGAPALPLRITVVPSPMTTPTPTALPTARPTAIPSPAVAATPTNTPTALPTPAPSTSTPTPTATPTATPESDASSACDPVDDLFNPVVNQATALGIEVECAAGPAEPVSGQIQAFRQNVEQDDPHLRFRSFMVLRDDTSKTYVLDGKDANTYEATITTYSSPEGVPADEEPATCSGLAVPEGYVLPTGRIGATWCDHSLWVSAAGWPWESAASATLAIQETTNGLLIHAVSAATATQPEQITLIAIDFGSRRATVY